MKGKLIKDLNIEKSQEEFNIIQRSSISLNSSPCRNIEYEEEENYFTFTPIIKPKVNFVVVSPMNLDNDRGSVGFFKRKQHSGNKSGNLITNSKVFHFNKVNNSQLDLYKNHSSSLKDINVDETVNKLQERLKSLRNSSAMEKRAKKTNINDFMEKKKKKVNMNL